MQAPPSQPQQQQVPSTMYSQQQVPSTMHSQQKVPSTMHFPYQSVPLPAYLITPQPYYTQNYFQLIFRTLCYILSRLIRILPHQYLQNTYINIQLNLLPQHQATNASAIMNLANHSNINEAEHHHRKRRIMFKRWHKG